METAHQINASAADAEKHIMEAAITRQRTYFSVVRVLLVASAAPNAEMSLIWL